MSHLTRSKDPATCDENNLEEIERDARTRRRENSVSSTSDVDEEPYTREILSTVLNAIKELSILFQGEKDKINENKSNVEDSNDTTRPREQPTLAVIISTQPTKFNPSITKMTIDEWVDDYERIAMMNQWSEKQMIEYFPLSLQSSARLWYQNQEKSAD